MLFLKWFQYIRSLWDKRKGVEQFQTNYRVHKAENRIEKDISKTENVLRHL